MSSGKPKGNGVIGIVIRDIGVIGIFITFLYATFNYLGPIKTHTEALPSMSQGIAGIQQNTQLIPSMSQGIAGIQQNTQLIPSIKEDTTFSRARTEALINPQQGGTLRTLDTYATIIVKPKAVPREIILYYVPFPTEKLPALPPGMEPVGYNFALIPHTLAHFQLPDSTLQQPYAEVFIPYENFGLDFTVVKATDLLLQSWNGIEGKWTPIEMNIRGGILHANITQFSLFALVFPRY